MKVIYILMSTSFLFSGKYNYAPKVQSSTSEKKIVVCIPSYNNQNYYKKNLSSVFAQNYSNYRVIYVEDASKDNTYNLVKNYICARGMEDKVQLHHNEENMGAMYNWYHMVHSCQDDEIIVSLDGDDWFAHKNVLKRINQAYQNEKVWVTYGQWESFPSRNRGQCKAVIIKDLEEKKHRAMPFCWSHVRTFYAGLFNKIPVEKFMDNDRNFFSTACDVPIMLNLIDLGPRHAFFIPDIIYIYNQETPLNDDKVRGNKQNDVFNLVRARAPLKPICHWSN